MKPLDPTLCYAMLRARDTRFDGRFFVGVRTTGIYCRPVCPARTPRSSSCRFFETAALAEERGFRPCLRCRPELAPRVIHSGHDSGANGADGTVEEEAPALPHAIYRHLQQRASSGIPVDALAGEIGFSPRHLRRMMIDHFGVSPVRILQTERLLFAKELLQETKLPVTEIAGTAGFGSLRRMNALFKSRYQLSPTSLRRNGGEMPDGGEELVVLRLAFRPPFAWDEMLNFLKARAIPGVELVTTKGEYQRTACFDGDSGWLRVSMARSSPALQVAVTPSLSKHLFAILARLRQLFDLDADPAVVSSHLKCDQRLRSILNRVPGLRVPGAWDPFETSVRAVLGQQVSVVGATTMAGRLVKEFGIPCPSEVEQLGFHFPSPGELAKANVRSIAALGMPASRAETIRTLASFASVGGLAIAPGASLERHRDSLLALKGIGDWTAQYVSMRVFRDPDAFPAGDLGLRKALNLSAKELLQHSQIWRPWRGYAAMYLWQSLSEY